MGKSELEFIDFAKVYVKAGDGGNGCVAFRREKYIPFGGPSGGNGGKGGDIYFEAKTGMNTLTDVALHPHIKAQRGEHGQGSNLYGHKAEDAIIYVPCGTLIKENGVLLADLKKHGERFLAAKGGKGGRGNLAFKSHYNNAPKFCENGEAGEEKTLTLELSLLADVGLAGFPNAGKSTLLSSTTMARPKIADYPFTTLNPNLGVVNHKNRVFLMADIPGLIENAHEGKGLGAHFLKHILRTKLILHLIDPSGFGDEDAIKGIKTIQEELFKFSPLMRKKEIFMIITKADADGELAEKVYKKVVSKYKKKKVFLISAVSGKGVSALLDAVIKILPEIPDQELYEKQIPDTVNVRIEKGFNIEKEDENRFRVRGKEIEKLSQMTNFEQNEGVERLMNIMKKIGIMKALKKMGVAENDAVRVADYEFNWYEQEERPGRRRENKRIKTRRKGQKK